MRVIDRIINTLKSKGYKQIDLANKLSDKGITKTTISDWKTGKSNSYYALIADIADFLNVSTDYLLTGREHIKNESDISISSEDIKTLEKMKNLPPVKRKAIEMLIYEDEEEIKSKHS